MSENNDREIFNRLSAIERDVAVIKERTAFLPDHEKRIRTLEEQNARRGGIIAALTTLGSAVGAAITWLVQYLVHAGGAQ